MQLTFFEAPCSCGIKKTKSRLNGLQTTHSKSGKHGVDSSIDFHVLLQGTELLFFRLKILFNWKIIVVQVTEAFLSLGN